MAFLRRLVLIRTHLLGAITGALALPACTNAVAAGWTVEAVPSRIDEVRDVGFMMYGAFGNAGICTISDQLFVNRDHPQHAEMYAAALAAFSGKFKVQTYVHWCEVIEWYSASPTTFNTVSINSVLNVMDP